jgi:hypothetical protein
MLAGDTMKQAPHVFQLPEIVALGLCQTSATNVDGVVFVNLG